MCELDRNRIAKLEAVMDRASEEIEYVLTQEHGQSRANRDRMIRASEWPKMRICPKKWQVLHPPFERKGP